RRSRLGEGRLGPFQQRGRGRALPDGAREDAGALSPRTGEQRHCDRPDPEGRAPPGRAHAAGAPPRGARRLRRSGDRALSRGRAGAAALVAVLLTLLAWSPGPVQSMREILFDGYQRLFPRKRVSAPVTIVQIDEASLASRGQWPWPRTLVAELVTRIAAQKPAAIGLDLLFSEPDR